MQLEQILLVKDLEEISALLLGQWKSSCSIDFNGQVANWGIFHGTFPAQEDPEVARQRGNEHFKAPRLIYTDVDVDNDYQ